MTRPEPIRTNTPETQADRTLTSLFWSAVFGWPLFILLWRLFR